MSSLPSVLRKVISFSPLSLGDKKNQTPSCSPCLSPSTGSPYTTDHSQGSLDSFRLDGEDQRTQILTDSPSIYSSIQSKDRYPSPKVYRSLSFNQVQIYKEYPEGFDVKKLVQEATDGYVTCMSFNKLSSIVSIGHKHGFCSFVILNSSQIQIGLNGFFHEPASNTQKVTGTVEQIYHVGSSNIVGFVANQPSSVCLSSQNKLTLWDDSTQSVVCNLTVGHKKILSLKLFSTFLVLCTSDTIYIISRETLSTIYIVKTGYNIYGVLDVFPVYENTKETRSWPSKIFIATITDYLNQLQIIELVPQYNSFSKQTLLEKTFVNYITCYTNSTLNQVHFSPDGSMLAMSSEKGVVIKVIDTRSLDYIYKLRRGLKQVKLTHMLFHPSNKYLCCSSETHTIHIFKLNKRALPNQFTVVRKHGENQLFLDLIDDQSKNEEEYTSSLLSNVSQLFNSMWSEIHYHIDGLKSQDTILLACSPDKESFYLHLFISNGQYYNLLISNQSQKFSYKLEAKYSFIEKIYFP